MDPHTPSFATLERMACMAEVEARRAAGTTREHELAGQPRRSDARALDDDALAAKLAAALRTPVDRAAFAALIRGHDSAEAVARSLLEAPPDALPADRGASKWLWPALAVLWERWAPERPSFEMLDDRMQQGYELAESEAAGQAAACDVWLELWRQLEATCEARGIRSVDALEALLRGNPPVYDWLLDLDTALHDAGHDDCRYTQERIAVSRQVLARFDDLDDESVGIWRVAIGQALAALGQGEAAHAEFEAAARASPRDPSVWTHWSFAFEDSDPERAARILERALAVPGLAERKYVLALASEAAERAGLAKLMERADRELGLSIRAQPIPPPMPGGRDRVGRNDTCPCGSGRKYKKCCLRSGEQ